MTGFEIKGVSYEGSWPILAFMSPAKFWMSCGLPVRRRSCRFWKVEIAVDIWGSICVYAHWDGVQITCIGVTAVLLAYSRLSTGIQSRTIPLALTESHTKVNQTNSRIFWVRHEPQTFVRRLVILVGISLFACPCVKGALSPLYLLLRVINVWTGVLWQFLH